MQDIHQTSIYPSLSLSHTHTHRNVTDSKINNKSENEMLGKPELHVAKL